MTSTRKRIIQRDALGLLGGSSSFSPLSIPGLALWLDASDASTLFQDSAGTTPATADNDVVGYWGDKSGNGKHVTQGTTAKKPLLKTAVKNGRNVVRFNGTSTNLAHTVSTGGAAVTVCAIVNSSGGARYRAIFAGTGGPFIASVVVDAGEKWGVYANADVASAVSLSGAWKVISVVARNYNDIDLVTNGSLENKTNGVAWYGAGQIVGAGETTSQYYAGDIAELLVYTVALSVANRQSVESYLNAKWGAY